MRKWEKVDRKITKNATGHFLSQRTNQPTTAPATVDTFNYAVYMLIEYLFMYTIRVDNICPLETTEMALQRIDRVVRPGDWHGKDSLSARGHETETRTHETHTWNVVDKLYWWQIRGTTCSSIFVPILMVLQLRWLFCTVYSFLFTTAPSRFGYGCCYYHYYLVNPVGIVPECETVPRKKWHSIIIII